MRFGEMSVGEMSVRGNVIGEFPVQGTVLQGTIRQGNIFGEEISLEPSEYLGREDEFHFVLEDSYTKSTTDKK